jgi:hypothetical protein
MAIICGLGLTLCLDEGVGTRNEHLLATMRKGYTRYYLVERSSQEFDLLPMLEQVTRYIRGSYHGYSSFARTSDKTIGNITNARWFPRLFKELRDILILLPERSRDFGKDDELVQGGSCLQPGL